MFFEHDKGVWVANHRCWASKLPHWGESTGGTCAGILIGDFKMGFYFLKRRKRACGTIYGNSNNLGYLCKRPT